MSAQPFISPAELAEFDWEFIAVHDDHDDTAAIVLRRTLAPFNEALVKFTQHGVRSIPVFNSDGELRIPGRKADDIRELLAMLNVLHIHQDLRLSFNTHRPILAKEIAAAGWGVVGIERLSKSIPSPLIVVAPQGKPKAMAWVEKLDDDIRSVPVVVDGDADHECPQKTADTLTELLAALATKKTYADGVTTTRGKDQFAEAPKPQPCRGIPSWA